MVLQTCLDKTPLHPWYDSTKARPSDTLLPESPICLKPAIISAEVQNNWQSVQVAVCSTTGPKQSSRQGAGLKQEKQIQLLIQPEDGWQLFLHIEHPLYQMPNIKQ